MYFCINWENNELIMPKLYDRADVLKKPDWLKIRLHRTAEYADVQRIMERHGLHTICTLSLIHI